MHVQFSPILPMSPLFEHLRSRLAGVFHLTTEAQCQASEASGFTLTAYLPDEDSAIEAVFAAGRKRKIAAANARKIDDPEEVTRAGGASWSLAMTFYVQASQREELRAQMATILGSFGGSLADGEQQSLPGRQAA
jgi:hypothetical protein